MDPIQHNKKINFDISSDSTFWKMKQNGLHFFGAKSHCFLPRSHSMAKAMQYADDTLS